MIDDRIQNASAPLTQQSWTGAELREVRYVISKLSRTKVMETSPEKHDFLELLFVIHGAPRFRIGTDMFHLSPGQLLIIGAGQPHQMIFSGESTHYERYVAYLSREYLEELSQRVHRGNFRDVLTRDIHTGAWVMSFPPEVRTFAASILDMLYRNQLRPNDFQNSLADDLWQAFFSVLILADQGLPSRQQEERPLSPLSASLLQYIEEHYAEEFSLEQIASRFYTSKNNLMITFRRDIGTSIYNYLLQRRVAEARHILLQGDSPTEAAAKCGFRDYSNFYRAFCSVYGCGPREYLKQSRKNTDL